MRTFEVTKAAIEKMMSDPDNARALEKAPSDFRSSVSFLLAILGTVDEPDSAFPQYLMWSRMNDAEPKDYKALNIGQAGVLYDSGFCKVGFGDIVIEQGLKLRLMTDDEKREISDIADRHSESK